MKIRKFIIHYSLFLILLIAAVLRLWKLGSIPPHLTPDEASFGYNAYSILKTGKDMYGETLPLIFKSFGDFRPGLYFYLTVPFIYILGLTEIAVRLPNALFGVLGVFSVYLLSYQLFRGDKRIALLSGFLIAVNPWHIHFSRGAWEPNVALTLTILGIYFFYKSFEKQKYLIPSSVLFALTFITYQGSKLSTTVVLVILFMLYWKKIINFEKKKLAISAFLGLLITLPIALSVLDGRAGRLSVLSILSYKRPAGDIASLLNQGGEGVGGINYLLFHSEKLNVALAVLGRWFNHFSARFLFFEGDWQNLRHSIPNHGMLLLIDLLLIPVGIFAFLKDKMSKEKLFILLWLLLAPLPAVLTKDQVHAVRALSMSVPLVFLSAYGLNNLLKRSKKIKRVRAWTIASGVVIFTANFIYLLDSYFIHLPIHDAKRWFYGYKQVVEYVTPVQANYENIIFQQSYDQPFIFFLFYQKYDPATYQKQARLTDGGNDVGLVENLDNITFERFSWPHATGKSGSLIIGNSVAIPNDFNTNSYSLVKEIKYPDDFETAFRILEIK